MNMQPNERAQLDAAMLCHRISNVAGLAATALHHEGDDIEPVILQGTLELLSELADKAAEMIGELKVVKSTEGEP